MRESQDAPDAAAPRPRVPILAELLLALVAGGLVGRGLGARAAILGELAQLFVALLKLLATPLVFFAIVDTIVATQVPFRRALILLPASATNALVAAAIALGLGHALPLGRFVDLVRLRAIVNRPAPPTRLDVIKHAFAHLAVTNLLWVIAAALATGVLLRVARELAAARVAASLVKRVLAGFLSALGVIVRFVPWAAFGITASIVGISGLTMFPVLGLFMLLVTAGIVLHVFGWYSLVLALVVRRSPARFFRQGADALGTALAAGSSLATLPVTLRTLDGEMHVSEPSARLAAVVGTNLNHDGIILYEATAALFVAQLYGLPLGFSQQLTLIGQSVAAAVGIAGVPEAGMITLTLVFGRVGLPLAAAPLLLPVDWLLGRLRAATNVASDMVVATLLDRFR
ncbi:MAG TPA: cation:dicarboxylase symporter family transporter [Polyangia bacterium]|nr:cation:dicarboxylase symporter family transporter [Polyangia bacterium]